MHVGPLQMFSSIDLENMIEPHTQAFCLKLGGNEVSCDIDGIRGVQTPRE